MSGKAPKQLTASELRRAEVRLRDMESVSKVAKIYGLRTAEQLALQFGDRWADIVAHRKAQRAGPIRKAGSAGVVTDACARGRR